MSKLKDVGAIILERHSKIFSLEQILKESRLSRKLVRDILWTLCEEGLIKLVSKKQKAEKEYGAPISHVFHFRPLSRKALAARIAPDMRENTAQDKVWFVVRKMNRFTTHELVIRSGVHRGTVRDYMKALRKIGVIQKLRKGGPGCEWTLVKDTGPQRPYVKM